MARLHFGSRGGGGSQWPFLGAHLFREGQFGGLYDPSDLSTLYQSTDLSSPATEPGHAVRLMLDKTRNGLNVTQADVDKASALGRTVRGGRVNRLLHTETLSNAVWVKTNTTVADQGGGVWLISDDSANGRHGIGQDPSISGPYLRHVEIKAGTANRVFVSANVGGTRNVASFNLTTGQVQVNDQDGLNASANLVALSDGWWRLPYRADDGDFFVGFSTSDGATGTANGQNQSYTGDGTRNFLVRFPQANVKSGLDPFPYQRVGIALDVTETGKKPLWFLQGDGIDDFMTTASINPAAYSSVLVGVATERLTDVDNQMVVSFRGSETNGSFEMRDPESAGQVEWRSRTTTNRTVRQLGPVAPVRHTIIGTTDLLGATLRLRVDGVVVEEETFDVQGTSWETPDAIGLLGRADGTFTFSGRFFGGVVSFATYTPQEIAALHGWLAERLGT